MHYIQAFIITYIIKICLIVNNRAVSLPYVHRKRELNFNNYPENRLGNYNNYNDPGYTAQNENVNEDKTSADNKTSNLASRQNFGELSNRNGQMFHLMYVTPHSNNRNQMTSNEDSMTYFTQPNQHDQSLNGNFQNLAYVGPHLFPTQQSGYRPNNQQLELQIQNVNTGLRNLYTSQNFFRPYQQNNIKNSQDATKMEAPFIPSQFLGYDHMTHSTQQQHQQLRQPFQHFAQNQQQQKFPQQGQQLLQQGHQLHQENRQTSQFNQQLPEQNRQFPSQHQQIVKSAFNVNSPVKPVHEQHQVSLYQPNLIYMAPNKVYDLYRKSK